MEIHDRTNVRLLSPDLISEPPAVIVADLSFISLNLVLPALASVAASDADFLLMVKPQFEVGRENLGAGGVVRDLKLRKSAVMNVAEAALKSGLHMVDVVASPLPGPSGNVEYFLWLKFGLGEVDEAAIDRAISAGPQ